MLRRLPLLSCAAVTAVVAVGQVRVPRLVSDGVVLQRGAPVRLHGWAAPGEPVTCTFRGGAYRSAADTAGAWSLELPAQPAGGPFELEFRASNVVTLRDVLFGDVWIASGQSNMVLPMERVRERYRAEIAGAANPQIRQFIVPDGYDFHGPRADFEDGAWVSADSATVLDFSAAAYFFARELNEAYGVPIGIVNAALGGSPVESWMSEQTLRDFPTAYRELQRYKDDGLIARIEAADQARESGWKQLLDSTHAGLGGDTLWSALETAGSGWTEIAVPGYWNEAPLADLDGAVWYRRDVDVPAALAGRPARLWLGRIVDADQAYLNGVLVGRTGYKHPARRYTVEAGILREGRNMLVVRVVNTRGAGGFVPDKP